MSQHGIIRGFSGLHAVGLPECVSVFVCNVRSACVTRARASPRASSASALARFPHASSLWHAHVCVGGGEGGDANYERLIIVPGTRLNS